MEVNKSYYPDVAYKKATGKWITGEAPADADFICSNSLDTYGYNQTLDTSMTYACSTSNYASLTAATTYGARYRSQSAPYINPDTVTFPNTTIKNYQGAYLCRVTGNVTDVSSKQTTYEKGGFSPQGSLANKYSNVYPITGFKYYSIMAVPIIGYCTIDGTGSNDISFTDLKGWRAFDKTKYGICFLGFGVATGNATSRSASDITLANAVPLNLASIVHGDEGYKILETKTILNYFPMYRSGGDFVYKMWHAGVTHYPNETYMNDYPGYNGDSSICKMVDSSFVQKDVNMWGSTFQCKYNLFNLSEEDIMHMCATYGLIFTTSYDNARSINLDTDDGITNDEIYFPVMTGDYWQGEYVHGTANKETKQYKEKWNADINAPFNNGSKIPEGEAPKYGDDNLTKHSGSTSALTHRYIVDNSTMQSISNYINNVDDNLFTAIVNNMKMSGESPINSIVSVMYSPIDISTYAPTTENIIIGTNFINVGTAETPTALTGNKLTVDSVIYNLGECTINPQNKNYLDYEPYTKYVCYIPFCNFVELESSIIMNKKIGFQLICDLVAGSCEGIIRIGGLSGRIYKSVGGTFATQCSVQGLDSANYVNGIVSSMGKYVSGIGTMIGATVGVATGGVSSVIAGAGLLAGVGTTASAIYDFNTNSKNFTATGKSIGLIGQRMPLHVCIYKFECKDNADINYGNFVGYACEFSETLSNLSGFTVCANAYVECNATNTEKDKIKELLESGIYL